MHRRCVVRWQAGSRHPYFLNLSALSFCSRAGVGQLSLCCPLLSSQASQPPAVELHDAVTCQQQDHGTTSLHQQTNQPHTGSLLRCRVSPLQPLHCHISWHAFMGQGITIIEDAAAIAKASMPAGMPSCPAECIYTFANFNPDAAKAVYGKNGLLAPDNSQLP